MQQNSLHKSSSEQAQFASFTVTASNIAERLASDEMQQRLKALRLKHAELKNILKKYP